MSICSVNKMVPKYFHMRVYSSKVDPSFKWHFFQVFSNSIQTRRSC